MPDPQAATLVVGSGPDARDIAVLQRTGQPPGLFWLGGYRSDMLGGKATALDAFGAARGLAVTRFDYSGHGRSGGDFLAGPQIVVGSSMGGWLALLRDGALRDAGEERVMALILIAPAVDMTEDLMLKTFTKKELRALTEHGLVEQPSDYSDEPYPITAGLIEDGRRHLLFGRGIATSCPVTILQGGRDADVPKEHALKLLSHLLSDPVTFTLVPDGDHRLSRPQDLKLLEAALERAVAEAVPPQLSLEL